MDCLGKDKYRIFWRTYSRDQKSSSTRGNNNGHGRIFFRMQGGEEGKERGDGGVEKEKKKQKQKQK
jgi:hypothetical protein